MKRANHTITEDGQILPVVQCSPDTEVNALFASEANAHEAIENNRNAEALMFLRSGGWKEPEKKFLRLLALVVSGGCLIGGLYYLKPDGTKKWLGESPMNPEAWHGPN